MFSLLYDQPAGTAVRYDTGPGIDYQVRTTSTAVLVLLVLLVRYRSDDEEEGEGVGRSPEVHSADQQLVYCCITAVREDTD